MSTGTLRHRVASEVRAELARQRRSASWLARQTGMGQTAVSRRLIGEVPMDLDDLERFASTLEVPLSRFIGGGTDPRGQSTWSVSPERLNASREPVAA
jgi:transcriptional regulator with XRE-family HTH domain